MEKILLTLVENSWKRDVIFVMTNSSGFFKWEKQLSFHDSWVVQLSDMAEKYKRWQSGVINSFLKNSSELVNFPVFRLFSLVQINLLEN